MEDLRGEVIKHMRSCMISKQELLSVRQLNSDYKFLIGEWIPFQKLGYNRLEDLIQSAPNEFILTKSGHEYFVRARKSEKSAHITEMVEKQKPAKKRPPKVHFFRYAPPPRLQQMSKWRPKSNVRNKYQGSKRPQAVSHSQFLNRGPTVIYKAPSVASKVVVPEHSSYNSKPQQNVSATVVSEHSSSNSKPQQNVSATVPPPVKKLDMNHRLTSNRLKENMKALSINSSLNGTASVTSTNGTASVTTSTNGTSNKSNNLSKLPNSLTQKPVQEQTVINDNYSLNPLTSTRKRLMKKITELSLDRDSGNSSPTSDILPPSPNSPSTTPDFVRTTDSLADLKCFAELHKLGEVKVSVTSIIQKKTKFYSCKIKVGLKHTFSSYPNEFSNPLEAQNFCCEEALTDLIPKFRRKSLMIASEMDMLGRIPPMLEKHPHGIWASQVKLDYSDKYNEHLPEDWLKIIDISPCVQIEKMSDDYILRHCRPGDALQKGQRRNVVVVPVSNVSVPANTIQSGEDGRLIAQVTCVMSASEIWCQQTGTEESKLYAEMMDRLQIYYQNHQFKLIPQNISIAGYYIAKYENGYYRARAVKVSDTEVDCFFIDWGDELSIPKSDIFELKREYASVQAQAFVCRLYGLEELYEVSHNSQSLASLYETPVVIEIALDVTNNENTNDALPVFMYDFTNGESINEDLISKLTIELASPILQPDSINEVYVSNIEPNGDVYVQVRSQGYENWLKLKHQIEEEINLKPPNDILYKVNKTNSREKLYFIKDVVDGSWNRIKLIDWAPKGDHAQIYFVDDGHADVIFVAQEDLYPLDALNEIFNNYPYQAVRVRMSLDQIPPNFVDLASKLMPKDQPIMLKIDGTTEDNFPLVKMFRRNTEDCLFCINTSIALDAELRKEENNNRNRFKFGQDCVPSTGALKCPTLPEVGGEDFSEVYIPTAVSPYNFFIQLLESKQQLDDMMERLQERYRDVQYGNMRLEDVLPGSIYASKHEDTYWYRTSVIKVIHSGSVSVFYCDFGYYQTVPVKQLVPLDREFMELPYQALKAKLTGGTSDIKPTQSKWTMEDCEQFKELIEKKKLYALLKNIEKDILYESDLVLKIVLVDTNTEDDIVISEELVKRGIAVEE